MGFDAVDAEHLVMAIDEIHAQILVTKDRDFHDRQGELKRYNIEALYPSEKITALKKP